MFSEEAFLQAACNLFRAPPPDNLTTNEAKAAELAAQDAGNYLVSIDKTDFAAMSEEERDEFVRQLIVAYRKRIREIVWQEPPF